MLEEKLRRCTTALQKAGTALAIGLGVLSILLGIVWVIFNITHIPLYGDTPEYLESAKTLKIDGWRSIGYPLIIKFFTLFGEKLGITLLFLAQLGTSLLAAYYALKTLVLIAPLHKEVKNIHILVLSAVLAFQPIPLHLSLSLLTDSFALSLTVIFFSALARYLISKKQIDYHLIAIVTSSLVASILIRQDKAILATAILSVLAIVLIKFKKKTQLIFACLLIALSLLTYLGNSQLQKESPNRPNPNPEFIAFDLTARGRMEEHYNQMPRLIKERIPLDLAKSWDETPSNWAAISSPLNDEEGRASMLEASKIMLHCCTQEILGSVGESFLKNISAPYVYGMESIETLNLQRPPDSTTYWTNSRMWNQKQRLTKLMITVSMLLLTITSLLALGSLKRTRVTQKDRLVMLSMLVVITAYAGFFATQTSLGFHIRYQALTYFATYLILGWTILVNRVNRSI